mgnify:CR=1 FL=1
MPALDRIHHAVRTALENDGWTITHDPYVIRYADLTLFAALGAERVVASNARTESLSWRSRR